MDKPEALSSLNRVEKRVGILQKNMESSDVGSMEVMFELMTARQVLSDLYEKFDDKSSCQALIDKIDQLLKKYNMSSLIISPDEEQS